MLRYLVGLLMALCVPRLAISYEPDERNFQRMAAMEGFECKVRFLRFDARGLPGR